MAMISREAFPKKAQRVVEINQAEQGMMLEFFPQSSIPPLGDLLSSYPVSSQTVGMSNW